MLSYEMFFTLALTALSLYLYRKWTQIKSLPPGPWGIPLLGYLPFIIFRNPLHVFEGFKAKYGSIFSLTLGRFGVVVLHDYKLIIEAYSKDVFMGRPAFELNMNRNHGQKRGILFAEGKTWADQRRYVIRNLRVFGFGKQNTMESLLQHELQEIVQVFNANLNQPFYLKSTFNAAVLNSLWFLCTGSRFEADDPDFLFVVNNFTENLKQANLTGVVFFFPWLLKKDILIKGFWNSFLATRDRVQNLVRAYIEEHKRTYDPDMTRDLIDALISQCQKTTDPESSFYGTEGELNILLDLVDLFLAGAETTSTTLQWAMLYMLAFPDVQRKVQAEIDAVIGPNRSPSLNDKADMLYTEATINETHRYCSMVPFSVYHSTMDATDFGGYKIPKDTVILANLRDAHFDRGYWGDPELFRPERFIDSKEKKIVKHEAFMPFSSGKRICLGANLASDTLFLFFTSLLQKYTLEKDPDSGPLDLEASSPCLIRGPKPYKVLVKPRNLQ